MGHPVPPVYSLNVVLAGQPLGVPQPQGVRSDSIRRDVILGGVGKDVLSGGPSEDFIFGGAGNDGLSGGLDRQAGDLLFGEAGADTFQLIPDRLSLLNGTDETALLTLVDEYYGGAGDDRVLFLGGDFDRLGWPVPDHVAFGYDPTLHTYRFGSLVWDIANQEFVSVTSEDGDFLRFAFFQTFDIERTVIETRAGNDIVHAEPEFRFLGSEQTFGIASGDFVQRALLGALEIHGGDGADQFFGGALNDTLDGGADRQHDRRHVHRFVRAAERGRHDVPAEPKHAVRFISRPQPLAVHRGEHGRTR